MLILILALSPWSIITHCAGRGVYYDADMIVNMTLSFASIYRSSCVRIISGDTKIESRTVFDIHKQIASVMYKTTVLYPFSMYLQLTSQKTVKVSCFKPIKVIIDSKGVKEKFAAVSRQIRMGNSLWLIITKKSAREFLADAYLPFDVELVVGVVKDKDLVKFSEAYRVSEGFPLRIKEYGNWTRSTGVNIPFTHLYERRSDLEGKTFRAGYIENWPMSSFKDGIWDGYFPRIWNEIAFLVNATTAPCRSRDGSTGSAKLNGSWSGLVGMLLDGSVDILVAEMSINRERSKVVSFTRPVLISKYKIYFTNPSRALKWDAAYTPFGRNVWIALLVWTVVGTISMALCYDLSWSWGSDSKTTKIFGLSESFFFVLQSLCQQGYPNTPRSVACRIVMLSCFLVSSILIPSYSAAVISSLTHKTPYKPFDTLQEMVNEGTHKLLVIPNSGQYDYFKNSIDPLHQAVMRKLIWSVPADKAVRNITDALENAFCKLKAYAFFSTEKIFIMKTEYVPLDCPLVSLRQELAPVYQGLVLPKHSPFSGVINYHLQKLFDIGAVNRIEFNIRRYQASYNNQLFLDVDAEDSFQMFFLLFCGLVSSVVFFALEKLYYRFSSRGRIQQSYVIRKSKNKKVMRKEK